MLINRGRIGLMNWPIIGLAGSLVVNCCCASQAFAVQAGAPDIADFITRLGGWFQSNPLTSQITNSTSTQQWVQASYSASLATNNTTLTITMTTTNESATVVVTQPVPFGQTGAPCLMYPIKTDTVTLDLREIQPVTKDEFQKVQRDSAHLPELTGIDDFNVWQVTLKSRNGQPLIREKTTTAWPQPPSGSQPSTTPLACSTLPASPKPMIITSQKDVPEYAIEFADPNQANYFMMLVATVAPTLNPLSANLVPVPQGDVANH
jgi:hypothetical protein